jgi:RNA polymerase-binding transcription factor DksA
MTIDIEHFKQKLGEEKLKIEQELKQVGRINPDDKTDWEPVAADLNISTAEIEERASEISDFEDRSAVEFELEQRLGKVLTALAAIDAHQYGRCSVCKEEIDHERLEANPAATTCRAHMG